MTENIGFKIMAPENDTLLKVCDTVLAICEAECDEATKQAAFSALSRLTLQNIAVTNCNASMPTYQTRADVDEEVDE